MNIRSLSDKDFKTLLHTAYARDRERKAAFGKWIFVEGVGTVWEHKKGAKRYKRSTWTSRLVKEAERRGIIKPGNRL